MSVGWVNDSTAGCEWCGSPQRMPSRAPCNESGVIRKSAPEMPLIAAPPPSSDVDAHSLLRMCAESWHNTDPHGGHKALRERALAAVPLVTGNTRAVGCSNTSRTTDSSCAVSSSPPYASAVPALARDTASRISGTTPAVLSERSSILVTPAFCLTTFANTLVVRRDHGEDADRDHRADADDGHAVQLDLVRARVGERRADRRVGEVEQRARRQPHDRQRTADRHRQPP